MKLVLRLISIALIGGVFYGGLVLSRANAELVRVSYGAGELPSVPLWAALSTAFGTGALVMFVLLGLRLTRAWMAGRRYRKEIVRLEAEVDGLRNLPVVETPRAPEVPAHATPAEAVLLDEAGRQAG